MRLGGPAGDPFGLSETLLERPTSYCCHHISHMLARISFRQVPLAARVYARSYTSSLKEGSVASSKEFGYVVTAFSFLFSVGDD